MTFYATVVGHVRKPDDGSIYIEIESEFWEATLHVDKFSHIIVLWWITGHDNPTSRTHLADYPPQEKAELSGVFASRSPARPTPIGLSIVAIKRIEESTYRIYIDQIDANHGTPVVDIKPYMPFSDKVDHARVPTWFRENAPRYTSNPL
ncbi:MAG: tRNA (N6-threonylcarbamoyladenosine(37)-N6)-methyltransferase TrmO [Promethearchaeota archaeon]